MDEERDTLARPTSRFVCRFYHLQATSRASAFSGLRRVWKRWCRPSCRHRRSRPQIISNIPESSWLDPIIEEVSARKRRRAHRVAPEQRAPSCILLKQGPAPRRNASPCWRFWGTTHFGRRKLPTVAFKLLRGLNGASTLLQVFGFAPTGSQQGRSLIKFFSKLRGQWPGGRLYALFSSPRFEFSAGALRSRKNWRKACWGPVRDGCPE